MRRESGTQCERRLGARRAPGPDEQQKRHLGRIRCIRCLGTRVRAPDRRHLEHRRCRNEQSMSADRDPLLRRTTSKSVPVRRAELRRLVAWARGGSSVSWPFEALVGRTAAGPLCGILERCRSGPTNHPTPRRSRVFCRRWATRRLPTKRRSTPGPSAPIPAPRSSWRSRTVQSSGSRPPRWCHGSTSNVSLPPATAVATAIVVVTSIPRASPDCLWSSALREAAPSARLKVWPVASSLPQPIVWTPCITQVAHGS
jgi:hypothetical protein